MLEEDHKLTASRGSTPQAIEYRAKQRALISQGKFMEAFEMDVQDLVNKGLYKKYEQAILQARAYAKSIDAQKLRPL
jgi:filamentous hemagglutinin